MDELDGCARCDDSAPDPRDVARWLDLGMDEEPARLFAACARCLALHGVIDRAHTEPAVASLGAFAEPLAPWLGARAVAARPELAGTSLLVADETAILVSPRELHRDRVERLLALGAPDVVVEIARRALDEATEVRLEWERVHPWPAPAKFRGTVALGAIACALAERAIPAHVPEGADPIVRAIERAAAQLALDESALALRAQLDSSLRIATPSHAGALGLAVRMLDELGHTGRRDNQDTLLDHARCVVPAIDAYWIDVAVPRAWREVSALGPTRT